MVQQLGIQGWCSWDGRVGATKLDGQPAQRNGTDGATIMAGVTGMRGLVQRNGMDSQHSGTDGATIGDSGLVQLDGRVGATKLDGQPAQRDGTDAATK